MYHFLRFMPGLAHDSQGIDIMLCCTGSKPPSQTVPCKIRLIESGFFHIFFDDQCYGFVGKLNVPQFLIALERTKQRACMKLRKVQPFFYSTHRTDFRLRCIGNSNIIEGLERLKFSFNSYTINRISIESGIESFRDEEYFQECRRKIINTRDYTITELQKLGFNVLNSKSNFLFISHITANASDLYQKLRDNGILVRYLSKPKIDNFLRVTIGTDEEMQEFIAKLQKII